jgi:glycosyltransferase involved in cell wall biosynthesis
VAIELAAALDHLGHRNSVQAIALAADGQSIAQLPALVRSRRLGLRTYVQSALILRRKLRAEPADVVVAHGGSAAIVVSLVAPATVKRVWQRILGFPQDRWGPARRAVWGLIARRFDGVMSLTSEMEREVRALGFTGPVWLVPNARVPERFTEIDRCAASESLRQELEIGSDVPLLAFVGHLVDQKQPEVAVDVLAEVRRRGHLAHLVIAGDGPRRAALERRIADLHLEGSVTLLGHRDDPELIFGGADLALITSRAEGIPGVAIEAQMSGCPVVTYLLGAVEDIVQDGVTGVIVPWPEPLLMAERVVKLLEDPTALRAMGAAAVEPAAAFTTAAVAAIYSERFGELYATR